MENLKYAWHDIGGEVIKDNEVYLLKDNKTLNNLVLSSTCLHRAKAQMDTGIPGKKKCMCLCRDVDT